MDTRYVEFSGPVFSDHNMWYIKNMLESEPVEMKLYNIFVSGGDVDQIWCVKTPPKIYIVPNRGNQMMSLSKYF